MEERLKPYAEEVEEMLQQVADDVEPGVLRDAVLHVSLSGGKRLRPALTLASFEACGGGDRDRARRFAVGVELVHTSALVADDVIDRSDLRRGEPTVHEEFSHDVAVLSSNVLLGKALKVIDDRRAVEVMVDAVEALGEGEAMELAVEDWTTDDYETLAYRKTASLFVAACRVGAVAADASEGFESCLSEYARHLGLAFQIRDDVLDYTSTADDLGKPVGRDALLDRPSVVAVHRSNTDGRLSDSVEYARQQAGRHRGSAKGALERLPESDGRRLLMDIADYAVERRK